MPWDEVAYWRKANQIHKWFVDNVQNGTDDCKYYLVKKSKIKELKEICDKILDEVITEPAKIQNGMEMKDGKWEPIWENGRTITNYEICEELLPTQDGFFFGGTNYDEYYLEDIEYTSKKLQEILETFDFENDNLYYISSW